MKKFGYRINCPKGMVDYIFAFSLLTDHLGIRQYKDIKKLKIKFKRYSTRDSKDSGFSFSFRTTEETDFSQLEKLGLNIQSLGLTKFY